MTHAASPAENLLAAPAYAIPRARKEALLLAELNRLTARHRAACVPYRRTLEARGVALDGEAAAVSAVPFVPARLFKSQALQSVPDEEVLKVVASSGTSGQAPSRIALDRETARLQSRWLASIMTSFLGPKRLPMILVDARATVSGGGALTARGAGLVGLASFGRDHLYALDEAMELDLPALRAFAERHAGETVLLFGFTFMVWAYLVQALERRGERLDLSGGILFHSGGWKGLADRAVGPDRFRESLSERCGIARVHDFYGMAEQTGGIYVECERGRLHAPNCSEIVVRDPRRFTPIGPGEPGLIQTLSILPRSYPGHSILTEDIGVILGVDDCLCGRLGSTFRVQGRLPRAELRGCSDTHAAGVPAVGPPDAARAGGGEGTVTELAPGSRDRVAIEAVCPAGFFDLEPLPACADATIAFLGDLSAGILALPEVTRYPEMVALAYWLRPASVASMVAEFRRSVPERELVMPRGTAFHVAPSNVDTIFLYSWALSALAGNRNVVRVGGVMDAQLSALLAAVRAALGKPAHRALAERNRVIAYPRTDAVNRYLSVRSDVRILWGGDETVAALRALPSRPAAKDIAFADRFSYAVARADRLAAMGEAEMKETARLFVNDSLAFDQLACSSARLVYLVGEPGARDHASARFWDAVTAEAAHRAPEEDVAVAMEKLAFAYTTAGTIEATRFVRPPGASRITVARVPLERAGDCRDACGGGFFFECFAPDIGALGPSVRAADQTVTAIGFTRDERLDLARALCVRGIDRIVPPGQALAFGPTWDGYVLLSELTRRIAVA